MKNITMTDSDRANRTSSEIFLCFTSRFSSSSMNISSKSIVSQAHARDQPASLSNSLNRRLRNNAIMKLGSHSSPMFSMGGKKRGTGLEETEPSSPKVTCIGQVRIKTKKQGNKMITLSNRREDQIHQSNLGNNSKNQIQQQKCLAHRNQRWVHLPLTICEALRAIGAEFSCLFPRRPPSDEKKEKVAAGLSGRSSCGAVFGRWLAVVQNVEREEERTEIIKQSNLRRHVLDDIDIEDEKTEARLSICIPPKNALLLMRYRSDPMKMSALANSSLETTTTIDEEEEDEEYDDDDDDNEKATIEEFDLKDGLEMEDRKIPEAEIEIFEELEEEIQENRESKVVEDEILLGSSGSEAIVERVNEEDELQSIQEAEKSMGEKETRLISESEETESEAEESEKEGSVLPDCLMGMMYERVKRERVKLSMEVSKETWVCSTDFIRCLPERKVKTINGSDAPKKKVSRDSNPSLPPHPARHQQLQQPPRSSISFPVPASLEHEVAKAMAYEPFSLTRCQSEPRRTPAKLELDACFWKNMKLEPPRISAAGVGF